MNSFETEPCTVAKMKKIWTELVCMLMCIGCSFAAGAKAYCLNDFIQSKCFADQFGRIQCDSANGFYPAATYEEIAKAFPGAVDRYDERAPEIRQILYRIPAKMGESSNAWSNSSLLYSYWKAEDGVFVVVWEGNASMGGEGLVAGRTFSFSALQELTPLRVEGGIHQDDEILTVQPNIIQRSPVYLSNNTVDVFLEKLVPEQIYCIAYDETDGFYLKSYLLWEGESIQITDCSFLIEAEMQKMMERVNEMERSD